MDPYKVLGVRPNATEKEIHAAYLALVKKNHPDRFTDPKEKERAAEKMKEINAAYDILTGKNANTSGQSYYTSSSAGDLARARGCIAANDLNQAARILDSINDRNAEWQYLYGIIYMKRGWYDRASQCLGNAARMEPNNAEYAEAWRAINSSSRPYSYTTSVPGGSSRSSECTGCDVCSSLLCADCCCECMGGDLIKCC